MKKGNYTEKIEFINAKDIQEMLVIALGSVYKLMKRPDFPAIKVSARRYVVPEAAFRKWLDDQVEAKKAGTGADAEWHP